MIYDVILILLFLALILFNAIRGAAKALAGILVSLVSYLGATYLGKLLSFLIYDGAIKPAVNKAVTEAVQNIGSSDVSKAAESIPGWLGALMKASGIDLDTLLSGNITAAAQSAGDAVNTAIRPVAVDIMTCVLTVLLFLLFYFVLGKLIIKPMLNVFRMPGIRTLDSILGGLIGFIDAFLIVSLLAYLLKLLLPFIKSEAGIFNESTIYNSFIFYHFYSGNIFTVLVSWL